MSESDDLQSSSSKNMGTLKFSTLDKVEVAIDAEK